MRNLVASSDPCGRVWIEHAEHGRFPPHGFYLSFPQQLTKSGRPHKGNTAKMLAFARKMAAVEDLIAALEASLQAQDSHYAHFDREGTAGANCPACISRREANDLARAALEKASA